MAIAYELKNVKYSKSTIALRKLPAEQGGAARGRRASPGSPKESSSR
jgi:hypothetical protein